jgi:hypothetical protein
LTTRPVSSRGCGTRWVAPINLAWWQGFCAWPGTIFVSIIPIVSAYSAVVRCYNHTCSRFLAVNYSPFLNAWGYALIAKETINRWVLSYVLWTRFRWMNSFLIWLLWLGIPGKIFELFEVRPFLGLSCRMIYLVT